MILIIGYGNPFRRDDGAGPALARMLGERLKHADVRVVTPHQLTPELAEEMSAPDVTAVLFVDASAEPATVTERPGDMAPRGIEPASHSSCFGHHFPPSVLLAYSKYLYGAAPRAWLISVPGHDFGFGEGLSEKTAEYLPHAMEKALDVIRSSMIPK